MATVETATEIRPFQVDIPEEALEDLRRRIEATRLPSKELVEDRSQGVQLATIQELATYWATDYDWRRAEARLNALPQFTTEIDGVDIHFIHVRSPHENALPLIMTHGWPGSVIEMIDSVGPLTDPTAHGGSAEDAFHLVLPSLPGYGFSGEPAEVGWDLGRTARAWAELMRRLGYTRYVAQGGDVGAGVTDAMGRQAPEGLIGIHTNLLVPALGGAMPTDTDEERAAAAQIATFQQSGNGYFVEMATRPQTIGYALLDSPVALAAWMIDHDTDAYYKIARAFVDGQPSGNLTRDNVLDNITAVLADRHRRLRGPVVLGGLRAGRAGRGQPAAAAADDPGRLHDVPRRDLADAAQLGRGELPERHLLQRGRQGRPLRRLGRAGALLRGATRRVRVGSLSSPSPLPTEVLMTTTSMLPDVGIELREGYAEVGDVNLHYVEAGDGPLIVLLHGFPEFWFGWRLQIEPLVAAGFRVVAPDTRGYNLSSKPEGFEAYAVDLLAADIRGLIGELGAESALLVGHDWGGSIAWTTAMNHPEVVDRLAILNAAHPRRLSEGLHHPSQLRKSWYFFFFATPGLPEDVVHARDWHFFRHFLEDANPPYTPAGNRTLRRGVVAARGSGRDDQLLPRLGKTVPEGSRSKASPDLGADTGHLGGARFLPRLRTSPSPTATTCPTSTAWSAWPTRRTGCITTRLNASTNC